MDAGFRTPLLDLFRRGDVPRDVRLLAAHGALAPRAHEQLALLTLLVADPDPDIARAAEGTIAAIPRDSLAMFLARSDTAAELRTFFAGRGITPVSGDGVADDTPLLEIAVAEDAAPGDEKTALERLAAMNVAQRVTRAMKGTREERAILIRDPNRLVAAAVLSSPKLTDNEIETFARMANLSEEILRVIASTRAWLKNYAVVLALTKNPKTPVALSMNMLSRLTDRDLRMLSADRNIPDVLRLTARKKLVFEK